MSAADDQLARLRREIDAIDDSLHDLVLRRAALMAGVAEVKRGDGQARSFLRPGREAAIMRRLATRNGEGFPTAALMRMWRELLCAMLPVQGPFSVAVGGDALPLWDSARDFYGSDTEMRALGNARAVLDAVTAGEATLGVLDAEDGEALAALHARGESVPHIVMRLPFYAVRAAAGPRAAAYVVSRDKPEESGEDVTVLAVEGAADPCATLSADGHRPCASVRQEGWWLVEIGGFHDGGASRRFDSGGLTSLVLGAYPAPLSA